MRNLHNEKKYGQGNLVVRVDKAYADQVKAKLEERLKNDRVLKENGCAVVYSSPYPNTY